MPVTTRSCTTAIWCLGLLWSGGLRGAEPEDVAEKAENLPRTAPLSFRNDVMAVLSKAGCNQGTCHGNANGKGGFRLSLRGFDPRFDHAEMTRGLSGRRLSINAADESLLLRKPAMQVPHGGGRRLTHDDENYRILHDWIAAGAPSDLAAAPRVTALHVEPQSLVLQAPGWKASLRAIAEFSDGTTRDVSRLAVYEPSQPIVGITSDGMATAEQTGEVVIGVRYIDRQTAVRLAFIPSQPEYVWSAPEPRSEIDRIVFARLRELQVNPAPLCDDVTFLRRATLDLLGSLPTRDNAEQFLADPSPDKRDRLIAELLERPEFAEHWALKWSDLLRNEEKTLDRKGVQNLHEWLKLQFTRNTPLDEIARGIVSARGSTYANPAANYYRAMRDPVTRAESTAQVFLGVRLQCAKCHNHPFDRWTQDDYYGWASLFGGMDYKVLENRRRDGNDRHEFDGEQIVYLEPRGGVVDPRTDEERPGRYLGEGRDAEQGRERLDHLADWLASPQNRFFARTQVNRLWAQVMGRGIVDPIDDFRTTNPPTPPGLLPWLAEDFVAHGFDIRHTLRTIMGSAVYQLASRPEGDPLAERNFAYVSPRRLSAEQLLDAVSQSLEQVPSFNGYPSGLHALELPGVQAVRPRDEGPSDGDRFLTLFGKPQRLQSCDCERSEESTLAQTFTFVSGPLLNQFLAADNNRIGRLLSAGRSPADVVDDLYWSALSRAPSEHESSAIRAHLDQSSNVRTALEDVAWGLLNSNEFLLRR